ncbi:TonB-dependent receptor [Novosphingobium kaempferiae]|uniref:TonB-dependent receptor n=1 Tax=Novosphingobium kaempferiae TaxID=2896849 RepID=UPI001E447409|nr:TonB-dependent receptor [Novosphingobium kaempferiae]
MLALCHPSASVAQVVEANAPAASSDAEQGDIVVTGIRNSLRTAISEKRETVTIVDVINAEDVGKLPDQNLAEVLENIPGVQIDRNRGVGSGVSIRGSSQNLVLINGRSTTPAADARGGISFDDLPAELIASVRVTKVPTADQIEGSVGGSVDLRTYRGLALKEPIRTIRADMEYAETADRYNPHLAAVFGQKFDTGIGEIGVVLAGNYQRQTVREDQLNVRYLERTTVDLNGDGTADPYLRPNYAQQFYSINDRTNKSLSGSIEWRPSSNLTLFVDGTYVDQKNVGSQIGVFMQQPNDVSELPFQSQANIEERTSSGYTYRQMTSGLIGGTQFRSTGESPIRNTESYLAAVGGEWRSGDVSIRFEASRAGSDTIDANFQLVAQYSDPTGANFGNANGRISPPFLFDASGEDLFWSIDRSSPLAANIGNPAYYQTFIARDNYTYYHNVENAQRVDASWELGWGPLRSIDAGFRFNQTDSRRRKTTQVSRQFPGVVASSRPDLFQIAPDDFFDFTGDTYTGGWVVARQLTQDPSAARAAVGLAADPPEDLGARFQVKERTYAGYLKANIDTTIAGMSLRGEIGARLVHTDQTASGVAVSNGVVSDVSATQKYTKVLPGVVFALEPADGVLVRASYAKSLRRPDFGQLAPTVVFPIINNYVSAGNPNLKPQTVDQFDIDAEWYFDRNSLLSVGLFYKKFHDLVTTVAVAPQLRDPALGYFVESNCVGGIWNPVAVDLTGAVGICTGINQPQNLGSATLKGAEVNFQHSFTYLPGLLSGFGVLANYTYQDGKRDSTLAVPSLHTVDGTPVQLSLPLRDLSKNNYNLTLFYEKAGFSARVRYTYRDAFLRTEATDVTNNLPLYQEPRSQLNASISYDINPWFAITVSGVNLTKEASRERAIFADGPLTQERSADRRFVFGVRGKL